MGAYQDRYFSILGDSLSTLAGYNPPECAVYYDWERKYLSGVWTPEDTWWGRVLTALGGKLLVNHSYAGSTVTYHPSCQVPSYGCSDARTGALGLGETMPDVVMVLMGLNDYGCHRPVADPHRPADPAVFSVAYATMLQKLRKQYPQAEIWCLTLPVGICSRDPDVDTVDPVAVAPYCRAIRQCARDTGCKVVELCDPQRPYDTLDGYHATATGMATLAEQVLAGWQEGGAVL